MCVSHECLIRNDKLTWFSFRYVYDNVLNGLRCWCWLNMESSMESTLVFIDIRSIYPLK